MSLGFCFLFCFSVFSPLGRLYLSSFKQFAWLLVPVGIKGCGGFLCFVK